MTTEAVRLIETCRSRGIRLEPAGDRLAVTPASRAADLLPDLKRQKAAVLQLLERERAVIEERAVVFREQIKGWTWPGVPLLGLHGAQGGPGRCCSCDAEIPARRLRCDVCRQAVQLVLGGFDADGDTPQPEARP